MKYYTVNELYELIAGASCSTDISECEHYIRSNTRAYNFVTVFMLLCACEYRYDQFINNN